MLRDHADAAAAGREIQSVGGVGERFTVVRDDGEVGRIEAGDEAKKGAFAGAGWAEDDGPLRAQSAVELKMKAAAAGVDAEFETGVRHGGLRVTSRSHRWQQERRC